MAACGLQLYRFGQAVSLCFFTATWRPDSFYDRVAANRREGLHTLCLLDIRVKEPSEESLCRRARASERDASHACRVCSESVCHTSARRGRPVYEPARYMSAQLAAEQLLEVEDKRAQGGARTQQRASAPPVSHDSAAPDAPPSLPFPFPCAVYSRDTLCVAIARLGRADQRIVCATLAEMAAGCGGLDLGPPLHSLVLVGDTHPLEQEILDEMYRWKPEAV